MEYRRVVVTDFAKRQLDSYIHYIVVTLCSRQAAKSIMQDFRGIIKRLRYVGSSLPIMDNVKLASHGYRRINFDRHNFFALYRVEDRLIVVDAIYHGLQDYAKFLEE